MATGTALACRCESATSATACAPCRHELRAQTGAEVACASARPLPPRRIVREPLHAPRNRHGLATRIAGLSSSLTGLDSTVLTRRLFLTGDNEFAGESQDISLEETIELTEAMGSIN